MAFLYLVSPSERLTPAYHRFARIKETEDISIFQAKGRVLAKDIYSSENIPPLPRSTVDGYAVKSEDTMGASPETPAMLLKIGEIHISELPKEKIAPGQTMYIPTGGILPEGADAVEMIEYTEEIPPYVEMYRSVAPGENTVQPGEDIKEGMLLISKGTKLHARHIGLLAYAGITTVTVYRKPKIAIFSTGDEIVPPDTKPGPGKMRDANRPMLKSLFADMGEILNVSPTIIPDEREAMEKALKEALETADIVMLSGGSSAGTRDLVVSVIESMSKSEILFHGLRISPGKPTIVAVAGGKPILGLPGHPASCFVSAKLIGTNIVEYISGSDRQTPFVFIRGVMKTEVYSKPGIEEYLRVKLDFSTSPPTVEPMITQSGITYTLAMADGLARIPPEKEGLSAGEEVEVMLL
ncbi:molybdopterin molybdenumtransferase MoeA [bacterium 3DAC]|nr:molybdopterin molybdenumtransferase MoeA [bacterium 3DAC]